jgi:hypothetical protein
VLLETPQTAHPRLKILVVIVVSHRKKACVAVV